MNLDEIRAMRIAEAERTKNMSAEEIVADTRERAKPLWDMLEKMKKEIAKK